MTAEKRGIYWVLKPRDNSVGALPAVPLTLALETLWKVHLPLPAPRLPSAALPSSLPCQFFIFFSSSITIWFYWPTLSFEAVSCPLRNTFPRLIASLSDCSSFCFLAFTSCPHSAKVSILSWLFSWAYSVSLAIYPFTHIIITYIRWFPTLNTQPQSVFWNAASHFLLSPSGIWQSLVFTWNCSPSWLQFLLFMEATMFCHPDSTSNPTLTSVPPSLGPGSCILTFSWISFWICSCLTNHMTIRTSDLCFFPS